MFRHDADGNHGMLENDHLAGLDKAIDLRQALQDFKDISRMPSQFGL